MLNGVLPVLRVQQTIRDRYRHQPVSCGKFETDPSALVDGRAILDGIFHQFGRGHFAGIFYGVSIAVQLLINGISNLFDTIPEGGKMT